MSKTKYSVAIFSHFDSRGGTTGIITSRTLTGIREAQDTYLTEVFMNCLGGEEDEMNFNIIDSDFTRVVDIWVPDDIERDGREIIHDYEGEYHVIVKSKDYGKWIHPEEGDVYKVPSGEWHQQYEEWEICKSLGDEEFEQPEHLILDDEWAAQERFDIIDDDLGEDAFGFILMF